MASARLKGKAISKPLPHRKCLLITQKLKEDIKEIQLCAAQALGFHIASVASKIPEALSTIIQKLSALENNIAVLDEIRREVSALYNELKSIQAQLRLKGESADLLLLEKTSLIEKLAKLELSFKVEFEDTQDHSEESCTENQDAVLADKHFDATSPAFIGSEELTAPVFPELDDETPTQEPSHLAVPSLSTPDFPTSQVIKSLQKEPEYQPVEQQQDQQQQDQQQQDQQQTYVKKPLNAYMLFLKEQRPHVKAEANSNIGRPVTALLGDQWKALSSNQKAKYFKEAEQQRLIHREQNPGWSNKINYGKKLIKTQKRKLEGE